LDYTAAIQVDPKDAVAHYDRALAHSALKEFEKAILDYGETIRLDPKYSSAYNNRAWIWATCKDGKVRDGKRAVESATKACELTEWKNASQLDTLAAAYAESGDFDATVKWQINANELYGAVEDRGKGQARLEFYKDGKPFRDGD
jgi:tetratricopeptide (TPR) repeat protein